LDVAVRQAAEAYDVAIADSSASIASALAAAEAIAVLRRQFTPPVIATLRELCGKPLGFKTDRDAQGKVAYPDQVLVDCALEAGLRGLPLVGNAWNILFGQVYVTKAGFKYLIRRMEEVTNFTYVVGLPKRSTDGAISICTASWLQNGAKRDYTMEIPVRVDSGTSVDMVLGKLERRLLARCYEQMSNRSLPEGDVESAYELEPTGQIEANTPKFLELPTAPAAAPAITGPVQGQDAPPAAVPTAPAQTAPATATPAASATPRRGRPPGSKNAPKPAAEPVVVAAPPQAAPVKPDPKPASSGETDDQFGFELEPPDDIPSAPAAASTLPPPTPQSPPSKPIEAKVVVTTAIFRGMLRDFEISEADYLGFLKKKHGLPGDISTIEQLSLQRPPLWKWIVEHTETAIEQAAFALGKGGGE
jgi:hypothetical protein